MRLLLILLALIVLFCASNARADCKGDCEQGYLATIRECYVIYDGSKGSEEGKSCLLRSLDQAKTDYEKCLSDCRSQWREKDKYEH